MRISGKWSSLFDCCLGCSSKRWRHERKGYCTRCTSLHRKLEEIEGWCESPPREVVGPKGSLMVSSGELQEIKRAASDQVRAEMDRRRAIESLYTGLSDVNGWRITELMNRLSAALGCDDKRFSQAAGRFERMTPAVRAEIFRVLADLGEGRKWRGLDWATILNRS